MIYTEKGSGLICVNKIVRKYILCKYVTKAIDLAALTVRMTRLRIFKIIGNSVIIVNYVSKRILICFYRGLWWSKVHLPQKYNLTVWEEICLNGT